MPSWKNSLWAIGCLVPNVVGAAILAAWALGAYEPSDADTWRASAYLAALVAVTVYLPTLIAAFVHITQRYDLDEQARNRWRVAVVVLGSAGLLFFWWRLIRPRSHHDASNRA